jgi:hypothetical protein
MVISIGQAWPAGEPMRPAITASVEKAREAGAPTGPDAPTLNFVNADIGGVVKVVSAITGKLTPFEPKLLLALEADSRCPKRDRRVLR